jgi:hypothetical protein
MLYSQAWAPYGDIYHFEFHLQQFAKEILADEKSEVTYEKVKNILIKASGAAYGTGK